MRKHLFKWMLLLMAFAVPWVTNAQNELTVYDGTTTNQYVPAYVYYWDDFTRSQFVIPASELEEMNGGTITSLTFYTTNSNVPYISTSTADVYMKEVDYTTISAFEPKQDVLYSGIFEFVSVDGGGMVTIELSTPYVYSGGNLLIAIENTTDDGYKSIYYYGQTVTGASIAASNGSSLASVTPTQRNFIPKTTFTYIPGGGNICYRATGLAVVPSTTTAVFSWVASETAVSYEYLYTQAGEDPDWESNARSTDGTSVDFDGLNPMTSYVAYVRSNCGDNFSSVSSLQFKTACDVFTVSVENPFTENFDDASFDFSCWTNEHISGPGTQLWQRNTSTGATAVHEGTGSLKLPDMNATTYTFLTSPLFQFDRGAVNGYEVSFWMYRTTSGKPLEGVKVYVNNQPNDTAGGTMLMHIARDFNYGTYTETAAGWYQYTAPIPSEYYDGNAYIILVGISEYGNASFIDDFSVNARPNCIAPVDITFSDITANSAVVSWTPSLESDEMWEIEYSTNDSSWISSETVTATSYEFRELSANTQYYVHVRTLCDRGESMSEWSSVASFRTPCDAITVTDETPYTYGFETEEELTCWLPGNAASRQTNSSYSTYSHDGNYCLRIYGATSAVVVFPVFANINMLQLDFYLKTYSTYYSCTLEVGYVTNASDASSFVSLKSLSSADYASYGLVHTALSAVPVGARLALRLVAPNTYSGFYIDDVEVSPMPSCSAPDNIAVADVTPYSAVVSWTPAFESDNAWEMEYSTNDTNWISTGTISSSSYELRDLNAATAYQLRVRTVCRGEEPYSEWSSVSTFVSGCAEVVVTEDNPYTCDFEHGFVCWEVLNGNVSVKSSTSNSHAGGYYLDFRGAVGNAVALPEISDGGTTGLQLKFWTRPENFTNANCGTLSVGYMTDLEDDSTYVQLDSWSYNSFSSYEKKEVSLASMPAGARIVMKQINNTTNYYWYVDDVQVSVIPSCLPPTNLEVVGVTSNAAQLSWNSLEGVTAWQLKNGEQIIDIVSNAVEMGDSVNTYMLTDLEANTDYSIQLRNNCGEDFSPWADDVFSFTTLNNATNVIAFNINGMVSADIDTATHTVTVTMLYGSDFTSLSGGFSLSDGAVAMLGENVLPTYFSNVDFSSPMTFVIVAEDTAFTQEWTLNVINESCATATGLAVAPERTKATLAWNIGDVEVEDFELIVSATELSSFDSVTAQFITVAGEETARSYELTGLERATEYHVYLKNACSDWSVAQHVVFTTHDLTACATFAAGTANDEHFPVYGYYCDNFQRTQSIYPAEMLANLQGKAIQALHYYVQSGSSSNWQNADFNVRVMVTEAASFETIAFADITDANVVYTGHLTATAADGMTITLDEPFTYEGGNLLVEFGLESKTGYTHCYFYGTAATNASVYGYNSTSYASVSASSRANFLPKIDFCYEDEACPAVDVVDVENVGTETATLTWAASEGDYVSSYDIILSTVMLEDTVGVMEATYTTEATSFELEGLEPYTQYYAYVRANCYAGGHEEGSSEWIMTDFRTNSLCHAADNLLAMLTERNAVSVTWTNDMESAVEYMLVGSADTMTAEPEVIALQATDELELTDLAYETEYTLYVRHICGDQSSPWQSVTFTTLAECPQVAEVEVTPYFNAVTFAMTNGEYSPATAWHIIVEGLDSSATETVFDGIVTSNPYTVIGLSPETQYLASIAAVCGETESEYFAVETFATPTAPGDCAQIGDATTASNQNPICTYYNYSFTEQLYKAEEIGSNGVINSIAFRYVSTTEKSLPITVFMKNVNVADLSAGFVAVDSTDQVFSGTLSVGEVGWATIELDTPFQYDGMSNLLVAIDKDYLYYYSGSTWAYTAAANMACYVQNDQSDYNPYTVSGGTVSEKRPNIQFCFEPSDCRDIRNLAVSNVTTNSADINWLPGGNETEWQMVVSNTELNEEDLAEAESMVITYINYTLTDLAIDADYYVYVRPICSVDEELFGGWKMARFATLPTCSAPVEAIAMAGDNGEVTFTVIAGETGVPASYDYEYWLVGDEENVVSGTASDSVWTLAGFNTNALYAWHVRANCGENDGNSRWTDGNNFYLCDTYVVTVDNAYTEDFSVAARLSCWASQDNGVDDEEDTYSYWTRGTDSEGNYWLYNSNYYGDIYLYSPLIQLPANGSATLSFIEFVIDGSYFANYGGAHMIYVLPENGTNQEAVVIYNPESVVDGTFERTLALDEFMGETFRLVFEYQGNNADRWGVTNLVIEASNVTNVTMADTACDSYDLVRSDNTVVATYTESGVYEETFEDPTLGPLHVTLNLTVNYSERNHEYVTNCGPYTWEVNGRTYNKGGDKYYKGTTEAGCVSYDTLSLTVIDRYTSHEVVSNCGPYTWEVNGRTYNQSGVKTYRGTAEDGCPTYDTLTLTINQGRTSHDYVTNCGAYTWEVNGQTYEQSIEVINDTFTAEGCPIHDTLTLTIAYGRTSHEYVSNCGPYFWEVNGQTYNKSGVKTFKSTTEEGCVNYDTLTLDIYTKISNHEYVTNCGPYFWEVAGKTYNKGGDKYYKGVNEEGCPVYDTLTLVIANGRTSHETVTACNAYTWEYAEEGMAYTESGLYTHNDVTEEGCDIHDTLDLTIVTKWSNNETVVSCGPYTWDVNGRTYNQGGMKTYKGTAEDGCYVYDTLNLTIAATERNHEYVTNCGPYFWEVAGKTYNKGGDKYYKGTTEFGCPIYDTLTLTIGASRATRDTVLSCGPYTWSANGQTYNKSGVKYYKGTSPEGCSLRDTLILTVAEVERNHEYVSSCGAYTWAVNNQTYNKGGNKYYKGTAENGCPIYDTLTLTIVDRWTSNETVVSCGPYTWAANGRTYNQSGTKIFKGTAEDGCMTYDTLNLTVNPVERNHEYVSNCGPYTWAVNNQTYNKGGNKYYKGTDVNGCPIYDTLTLTIVTKWTSNETVLSCGPYTWAANGQTYNKSGVKYYKGTAADGCPSYDTLHLTVAQGRTSHEYVENCGAYTWDVNGQTYNKSGRKTYKATTDEGCPIRDTLDLTIVTKWTSHEYVENCGPYTWEVNGKTYNKGGDKYYKSTAEDGCPVYDTLTLVINNCEPTDNGENIALGESDALNAMTIYPNPTTGRLQINAAQVDKVEVLDMVGRRVAVYENTLTLDLSNLAAGTYTLRVTMPEGVALRKVVKR